METNKDATEGQEVEYQIGFLNDEMTRLDIRLEIIDDIEVHIDNAEFSLNPQEQETVTIGFRVPGHGSQDRHQTIINVYKGTIPNQSQHDQTITIQTTVLPVSTSNSEYGYGWIYFLVGGLGGLVLLSYLRPWWSPLRYVPLVWIWGYIRHEKDAILDNPLRLVVYDTIRNGPGISEAQIVKESGFSRGAVRYAISRLEEFEFIKRGDLHQYYSLGNDRPPENAARLPHLDQNILFEIKENHLHSQKELAKRLELPTTTLSYRLRRLVQRGHLRPLYWGRTVRYELTEPPT